MQAEPETQKEFYSIFYSMDVCACIAKKQNQLPPKGKQ